MHVYLGKCIVHFFFDLLSWHAFVPSSPLICFCVGTKRLPGCFQKLGADVAKSPADVAAACPEIVLMLPSKDEVDDVFSRDDGILSTIKAGTLCIDCSTVDYGFTKSLSERIEAKTAHYVDAPASGGVLAAKRASLTFMIGGDHLSYHRAKALLVLLGRHIVHCGPVGSGQAATMCNRLLFCAQMIGLSEVLNLAEKLGISPDLMTSVINLSSGRCFASENYNPVPGLNEDVPASRGYTKGLKCHHAAKHLQLAQYAAMKTGTAIPLTSLASQIYRLLGNSSKYRDLDVSAVIKFLKGEE
ncbi:unnamed protein product [Enterobius vermicularis]|uniref:3-hydroxyisobutyrate dehydrogenase n=1 Tax=Enterobius vermicularis TaxID=51028 RepID=A0A0N4VBQ5_ENTVE|nr:unnamed protein product [Enterobius vermicularis]